MKLGWAGVCPARGGVTRSKCKNVLKLKQFMMTQLTARL